MYLLAPQPRDQLLDRINLRVVVRAEEKIVVVPVAVGAAVRVVAWWVGVRRWAAAAVGGAGGGVRGVGVLELDVVLGLWLGLRLRGHGRGVTRLRVGVEGVAGGVGMVWGGTGYRIAEDRGDIWRCLVAMRVVASAVIASTSWTGMMAAMRLVVGARKVSRDGIRGFCVEVVQLPCFSEVFVCGVVDEFIVIGVGADGRFVIRFAHVVSFGLQFKQIFRITAVGKSRRRRRKGVSASMVGEVFVCCTLGMTEHDGGGMSWEMVAQNEKEGKRARHVS